MKKNSTKMFDLLDENYWKDKLSYTKNFESKIDDLTWLNSTLESINNNKVEINRNNIIVNNIILIIILIISVLL